MSPKVILFFNCKLLLLSLVLSISSNAADGVPANFQSVENPAKHLEHSFIFRSDNADRATYYKVEMNEIIFSGLNAFYWPDSLKKEQKIALPAFSSQNALRQNQAETEVMFNEHLILSYSPELWLRKGSQPVRLKSASALNVYRLVTEFPAEVWAYDSTETSGLKSLGKTPLFIYGPPEVQGMAVLFTGPNKIPEERIIQPGPQKFKHISTQLADIPRLESHGLDILLDVDENSSEKTKLQIVDSILQTSRTALQKDSTNVFGQLDSIIQSYSQGTPRQSWESESQFEHRRSVFAKQRANLGELILRFSNITTRHQEFREKIMLMQAFRESLVKSIEEAEAIQRLDARKELMKTMLWGRFYLNGFAVLGRNMPETAADPGPADSWGVGGNLMFSHQLWKFITISYKAEGSMYRWKYFASIPTISAQERGYLGVNFSVPLLAAVHSYGDEITGFVVALRLGGYGGYGRTAVDKGARTTPENFDAFGGGSAALDIYPPSIPLVISLEYTYDSMHFGDLRFGFGLPLSFIPILGQGGGG